MGVEGAKECMPAFEVLDVEGAPDDDPEPDAEEEPLGALALAEPRSATPVAAV